MKKYLYILLLVLCMTAIFAANTYAQMEGLHGNFLEHKSGLHAGNQFRTSFYNDGTYGGPNSPPDIRGEWPINSGRIYMIDGNVFVGAEVLDADHALKHIVSDVISSAISYSTGDQGPDGEWWTFLPLPGFANPNYADVAMSKWGYAWPSYWPDKLNDPVDPGWRGKWNGYFGKDIFNADEESFYVADDYNNMEFNFYPDKNDSSRRGLGIRMWARGFQWSNALVEDALFVLFDLENVGTYNHDKMVFAYKFGNNMGDTTTGGDANDDNGAYDKDEDVAYLYDFDDIGYGGFTPVGYFGGAFMESPGNPYDGIDNDGDGYLGSGGTITESMFVSRTLNAGDDIVLIDYLTFERTVTKMPNDTVRVNYQDLVFKFYPGKTISEIGHDLVDNNLNGVIDESNGAEIGVEPNIIRTYLYVGARNVDYFTGAGLDNLLLDERRDDGIDNDGDWDPLEDDLGADGAISTGDPGEGDRQPTYGEPHFDKVDIDETDMLGLTSFTLYYWPDIPHYEDELVWQNVVPGFFDDLLENTNVELLYGSGYFPMKPGQFERFSMGIMCGSNLDDFLTNKYWVAKAYNENYSFSKAPSIPNVRAVPGDNRVTLIWDTSAEESIDPITGNDFEGYRIYRSTEPGWQDMLAITDGIGSVTYRKPIAQFDIVNDYSGYAAVPVKGVHFWMGNNTGIVNTWTDSTAKNGYTYYYAVTSYDRGSDSLSLAPTECSKFISVSTSGEIDKGNNVIIARPEAPAAGYKEAGIPNIALMTGGRATGTVGYEIIDPTGVLDNHHYQVTFEDSINPTTDLPVTKSLTLIDVTVGGSPVTLINKNPGVTPTDILPVTHGFRLKLNNDAEVVLDETKSGWSRDGIYAYTFNPTVYSRWEIMANAADYRIDFYDQVGADTATQIFRGTRELPAVPVNFKVTNLSTGKPIDFALYELDGEDGMFSAFSGGGSRTDAIIFLEAMNPARPDTLYPGWQISLVRPATTDSTEYTLPKEGDYFEAYFNKPFLSHDVFEFATVSATIDKAQAKVDMNNIKVVPNPYVVTNSWEPLNPYANGRGPRELHFINLPNKCTIKIFNIRGQLVREIEHNSASIADGTVIWDMLSKDNLDISYGVYIYYVDAGELGEKIGKFAIIK